MPMRASLPMVEVLRGLLCDDPDERWTVDDIQLWLNGRHLSPKQPMLPRKAARGFQFLDQSYWTAPMLSYALGRNWDEALRLARNGSIELWVQRSLADDDIAEAIAIAVEVSMAEGAEGDTDHILLSMILMALDPKAPIRYRDFSARIDGMHKAFALCFADRHLSDLYLEAIKGRLPQFWFRIQAKSRPEHLHLRRVFDSARRTLVRLRAGFAAERILYMTNPGWPCQSSLLARDYVSEIGEILTALDRLIAKGEMHEHTVDPHIVAFCAANHKRMPEAIVMGLHHEEDAAKYALYVLQLFGEVQRAFGPAKVRTLVRWCAEMVGPVIETYHNRQIRERLTYGIPAVVEEGSIVSLLYLVDDIDLRETDTKGFEEAQARFARYAQQIGWIKSGGTAHPAFIKRMARPVASVATAVLSSLVVLAMAMAYAA